ncbi:hypothetical protein CAC42_3534 [Sphaceloma murrayae]|uniref:Uncharacterized protein n=1 Tax=Sphaceloma murrayae TaxID=2082308 RepID=A0A2K1R1M1_9PEZI|nr:hypothetical protein CAC42_3534 [Sphaceloma murrayae]
MAANTSSSFVQFVNPATQDPLFVAEWITCAYPASDIYGSLPRYLYYALLVGTFVTQWYPWVANAFLGVAATYAGTAAIEAMILIGYRRDYPDPQVVSIPLINSTVAMADSVLSAIPNLVMDRDWLEILPAAMDFDMDAVLAVTVTGYLTMLPVHCWSSFVRGSRARHLLVLLWNALMLAGSVCALVMWPSLLDSPLQYRFCYPSNLDSDSVTSDGDVDNRLFSREWNNTIWKTFLDYNIASDLNTNCLYPCSGISEILRRPNQLVMNTQSNRSPRTSIALANAGVSAPTTNIVKESDIAYLMVVALVLVTLTMLVMLIMLITGAHTFTRVPLHRPKEIFRKEGSPFPTIWCDLKKGSRRAVTAVTHPRSSIERLRNAPSGTRRSTLWHLARFGLDLLALLILFISMVLTPCVIFAFVIWIEWYIHRDVSGGDSPTEVGQWATSVGVGLVLVSALVLKLKNWLATKNEVERDIEQTELKLEKLRALLRQKTQQENIKMETLGGSQGQRNS